MLRAPSSHSAQTFSAKFTQGIRVTPIYYFVLPYNCSLRYLPAQEGNSGVGALPLSTSLALATQTRTANVSAVFSGSPLAAVETLTQGRSRSAAWVTRRGPPLPTSEVSNALLVPTFEVRLLAPHEPSPRWFAMLPFDGL